MSLREKVEITVLIIKRVNLVFFGGKHLVLAPTVLNLSSDLFLALAP
jgi:hypothetical protein